jgi:hypothetical protein
MNVALRKEIRLLMPAWIVALLAATLPIWLLGFDVGPVEQISFILFTGGALLLSVSSFGTEMSFGTFPSLLAQPQPRVATWRLKIGVLAAAHALIVVACCLSWWLRAQATLFDSWGAMVSRESVQTILLLMALAFAGGLWTTLLFRQMAVAFWFAILVPLVLYAACLPVLEQLSKEGDSWARWA